MTTEVRVALADGVVVGPNDKLFIHIPADEAWDVELIQELTDALDEMGLRDRALVISGEGVKFVKVEG